MPKPRRWSDEEMTVAVTESASVAQVMEKLRVKCSRCNITTWQELPAPLELDHIDGNSANNDLSNLRILCANCHAQTPTYKSKNKESYQRRRP